MLEKFVSESFREFAAVPIIAYGNLPLDPRFRRVGKGARTEGGGNNTICLQIGFVIVAFEKTG